jgi:hypothetical protein
MISSSKSEHYKTPNSKGWMTKRGDIYLLCPFHIEKTPSCVIHIRTSKYFHCYGCGKSGKSKRLNKLFKIPNIPNRGSQWELDNPELPW